MVWWREIIDRGDKRLFDVTIGTARHEDKHINDANRLIADRNDIDDQ